MTAIPSRLKKTLAIGVAGTVVILVGFFIWASDRMSKAAVDCQAQENAARTIMVYHEQHHQLPQRWEDLREAYDAPEVSDHMRGKGFEELQNIVAIDFSLLPEMERLGVSGTAPEKLPAVIRPLSGRIHYWSGAEPNRLLYEHFRQGKVVYSTNPDRLLPSP